VFNWMGMAVQSLAHRLNANSIEGSRRNISAHYDAGNDMYKLFLDPTMMYSSAIHTKEELTVNTGAEPPIALQAAQERKLAEICRRAGITSAHHVLEVGCGWGGFAIFAAKTTGCRVTGITISKEQLVEAQARVEAEGLAHLVDLRFCDYRHLPEVPTFDRVVSIEMLEAVGHEHLHTYFDVIGRVLLPGGKAVVQV
jgi:cyclopropane fatty-acyl-phospholipid synthase-like methyltransferase